MIDEELRTIVADILGVDPNRISAESGPATIDTWDSLAHLSIITAVEERFGVKLTMSEIQLIDSVGALAKAVANRVTR